MGIDWITFSPWPALAGGMLIGLAAGALILAAGQVAGISGILGNLLQRQGQGNGWRWCFVLGLVLAPLLVRSAGHLPEVRIDAGWPLLLAGGVLVGIGTRMASGCTSGHGICGLARFSPRSLAATLTFMASGMLTLYLIRHLWEGL